MTSGRKSIPKPDADGVSLDLQRRLFIDLYLASNCSDATSAAERAGYKSTSRASLQAMASRMLAHPDVAAEVARRRTVVLQKSHLTTERVLQEIARIAFMDPRKLLDEQGKPKPLNELDDDTAACIAGMDVMVIGEGAGTITKYKLADKNSALEKAMKHLGEYEKDNRQRNPFAEMDEGALMQTIMRKAKEAGLIPPAQLH